MDYFHDASLIITLANIVNTIGNIYWSSRLKSIQGNKELMSSLKEANDDKDKIIEDLKTKKDQYKRQYFHQLMENRKLEGRLSVHEKQNPLALK